MNEAAVLIVFTTRRELGGSYTSDDHAIDFGSGSWDRTVPSVHDSGPPSGVNQHAADSALF